MTHRRTLRTPWACALALFCAAGTLVSTTAFVGCSGLPVVDQGDAASVTEVVALGLSSADVTVVTITVTGGPSAAGTTTFALVRSADQSWSGSLSGLPVGTGYRFTLNATNATGGVLYSGAAYPVTIVKDQITKVMITAQQATPAAAFENAPPVVDSLVVSSIKVTPGESVALTATAHDPNAGDTLSYTWTGGGGGSFSAPSSNATIWTAPAVAGTYSLLLTVTDSAGASVTMQVSISVNANNGKGSAAVTGVTNTWPVVTNVTGTPNYLVRSAKTLLTALANDADGDPITYEWTTNCVGTFTGTQLPTPSFTLDSAATDSSCTFTVAVADNRGGSTSGSLTLPVGKPATLVAPTIGKSIQTSQSVGANDSVSFTVNATDPQGLALTFSWAADGGSLSTPNTTAETSQVTWTPPGSAASSWTITATVTDSAGVSTVKAFNVRPSSCFGIAPTPSTAWSMAVMSDTQWTTADDGKNPNSVAVDIINQLNTQFIAKGVKFVVAVGDITDNGSVAAIDTRAKFVQPLYNAGIGFYPLRGNHESSAAAATEFLRVFPQTRTGSNNESPSNVVFPNLIHADDANTDPAAVAGLPFVVGSNFTSPPTALAGLSYAFDYNNARFVLLDQFTPPSGSAVAIPTQQTWIDGALAAKPTAGHAFVFAHKGILTQNHADTLFGSDPSKDPAGQDAFISSLQTNGVRYFFGGHDHMHNRAIVTTTDGTTARVQNIIAASDSSKFYTPTNPSLDVRYNVPAFGHPRETPIMQELYTVGYYVVTVQDAKATVDFYSAAVNTTDGIATTPQLNFTKRESFGYGLNGKQFVIAQGASYGVVQDSFGTTTARILDGTNANTNVESGGRNPSKTVDTGWAAGTCATSSAILSLWTTVSSLGIEQTDNFTLSMTFDAATITPEQLASGAFGLATKDASGNWVNATNKSFGGTKSFVLRAWQAGDPLGTYGVDPLTNTAWAVINYGSDFAVASFSN